MFTFEVYKISVNFSFYITLKRTQYNYMPIITLTSDWNNYDYYSGALKGALIAALPSHQVVDISHQVGNFNLLQAAFVVRNSYHHFPAGSIHVICVNSSNINQSFVACEVNKHTFICPDNGIIGLLFQDKPEVVYHINHGAIVHETFPELDLLPETIKSIVKNKSIKQLGTPIPDYQSRVQLRPTIDDYSISGSVIYIDSFRNLISNIDKNLFERLRKERKYEIIIQSNNYKINKISKAYYQVPVGELVAVFNAVGLLEIAIHNGRAADLLSVDHNSAVRVKFIDKKI